MFYGILALSTICICFYLLNNFIIPQMAKAKTYRELQPRLFSKGEKRRILAKFHEITANRFSDRDVLDYYIKVKGTQISKYDNDCSFWVKRYLTIPANIKLNYFEQVRFYEVFMGYSMNEEPKISTHLKAIFGNYQEPSPSIFLREELA